GPFPASRIPSATPFIIDPHTNFSLRREGPGLLLGHGRRDEPDGFSTEIDRSLEPALIERAIHRAPALADAELMRAWAGLYEMTPDQTGIVSAVPAVLARVGRRELIDLASDLIRSPSFKTEETPVARFLEDFFRRRGYDVDLQEIEPGRLQTIATLRGTGGGASLMLNGHTDINA